MRKITERVPTPVLMTDLERYRQLALSTGCTDARVLPADRVIVDERVTAKCSLPKCSGWGTSVHCPPYAMKPEQTRLLVSKYRYCVFYTKECPPSEMDLTLDRAPVHEIRRRLYETCARIESTAFYDGYHLALGFWEGACRALFCPGQPCAALQPGQACRAPLKARSSMEAVGIDSMVMAAGVGWDIYPCGRSVKPEDVPFVRRMGLVLID